MQLLVPLNILALFIHFFTWTYVFALNRKAPLNRSYLILIASFICWTFMDILIEGAWVEIASIDMLRIMSIFWLYVGLGILNFVYNLLERSKDLIYGVFTSFYIIAIIISFNTELVFPPNIFSWSAFIFNLILPTSFSIYLLINQLLNQDKHKYHFQIKVLVIGILLGFFVGTFTNLITEVYFGFVFEWRMGSLVTSIQAFLFLPSLIKYNFLMTPVDERAVELFNTVDQGFIIVNENGNLLNVNKKAGKMFQMSRSDWKLTKIEDYISNFNLGQKYKNFETNLKISPKIWISLSVSELKEAGFLLGYVIVFRDISEKHLATEALKLSEARLEEAQSVAKVGNFQYNIITNEVSWSRGLFRIYGLDSEKYKPTNEKFMREIVHPEDIIHLEKIIKQAMKEKTPHEYSHRIIRPDGSIRTMHCNAATTYNKHGDPIIINGTAQDITELQTARAELSQSEEKFRNIFEQSPDPIVIHDNVSIYYGNPALVKLCGMDSLEDLISLKVENFFSNKYIEKVQLDIVDYMDGKNVKVEQQEILLPNGTSLFVDVKGIRTEYNGQSAIQSSIRDVTLKVIAEKELRKSEEKYRDLIEGASDIIYNTDINGIVNFVNPVFERLSGYKMQELLGIDINQLVAPDFREKIKEFYFKFFNSNKQSFTMEAPCQKKNGEIIWLELNTTKVISDKIITELSTIARDITERKRTEYKLQESEERYRQLVENSTEMIYKTDFHGNYTFVNQVFIKNSGLSEAENLNSNCFDRVVEEYQEEVKKFYKIQNKNKNPISYYELPCYMADKKIRWVSQVSRLELDEFGNPSGYSISARDITEKHEAEEALKNSEERYRKLIEQSPYGIVIFNKHEILFVNKEAVKIAGANDEEGILSKEPTYFVVEEDLEFINDRTSRTLKGEDLDYAEHVYKRIDGTKIHVESKSVLVSFKGQSAIQTTIRDITDRIRAEQVIRENEKKFRELYNSAPAVYFTVSVKGIIENCNKRVYDILGYEYKDLIGEPIMKLYADNEFGIKKAKVIFANFKKGIPTINKKLQMIKKDGDTTWASITVEPVKDENGKIIQSRSMVVDINAQVESQRQLESSRLQMLQAQNIAKLGSWEWDIISGQVTLSENLYEIYGVDKTLFNGSMEEFIGHVHEEDREYVSNAITSCKETLIPMDFHHRTIPIKNKISTVHCNGVIISDESGTPISLVGTAQNVTDQIEAISALKKSEISLANAQEISSTGSWEENYETGELFWSDECKRILGFDREDKLIQGDFWKVVHPDDIDELKILWDNLKKNPKSSENTFRIILKDGSIRHIRERAQFQKNDIGQLKVVLGTIQDITQEMETEKEIMDSREQLRELSGHLRSIQEEERANIAREIHDELGQGLTGIKMDLSWLRNKLTEEDIEVNERIDSLNFLIDDTIQSVRRISSELHPAVLDDLGLKAAIEWQASEFGKRSGISCAIKISDIGFDKKYSKAIFRIIQESLTNIMRHAQADKVSIIIDKNGKGSVVRIVDNGIGFEAENKKNKESFGLMGMKERAYELGASLDIIAEQGKGTTIELNIAQEMEQS